MWTKAFLDRALRWLVAFGVIMPVSAMAKADDTRSSLTAVAVANFDYIDTSGEVRDQKDLHAARVRSFSEGLRTDLAGSGGYRIVNLNCAVACSALDATPSKLLEEARHQGARLLVFGGIHKQSTLIQWLKVEVIDLQTDDVVLDRLMSFRGDDDDSWHRAEAFLVKSVLDEQAKR
jgi:hypothetical protein